MNKTLFLLPLLVQLNGCVVFADGTPTVPASQTEVNNRTNAFKYVTPKTLAGSWVGELTNLNLTNGAVTNGQASVYFNAPHLVTNTAVGSSGSTGRFLLGLQDSYYASGGPAAGWLIIADAASWRTAPAQYGGSILGYPVVSGTPGPTEGPTMQTYLYNVTLNNATWADKRVGTGVVGAYGTNGADGGTTEFLCHVDPVWAGYTGDGWQFAEGLRITGRSTCGVGMISQDKHTTLRRDPGYLTVYNDKSYTDVPVFVLANNVLSTNITAGAIERDASGLWYTHDNNIRSSVADTQSLSNYSSSVAFTNAANTFTGTFSGNGSGLTGLNVSNIYYTTAFSPQYFISTTGNDSNNGTNQATPWMTGNHFIPAYSQVALAAGVYTNVFTNLNITIYADMGATYQCFFPNNTYNECWGGNVSFGNPVSGQCALSNTTVSCYMTKSVTVNPDYCTTNSPYVSGLIYGANTFNSFSSFGSANICPVVCDSLSATATNFFTVECEHFDSVSNEFWYNNCAAFQPQDTSTNTAFQFTLIANNYINFTAATMGGFYSSQGVPGFGNFGSYKAASANFTRNGDAKYSNVGSSCRLEIPTITGITNASQFSQQPYARGGLDVDGPVTSFNSGSVTSIGHWSINGQSQQTTYGVLMKTNLPSVGFTNSFGIPMILYVYAVTNTLVIKSPPNITQPQPTLYPASIPLVPGAKVQGNGLNATAIQWPF